MCNDYERGSETTVHGSLASNQNHYASKEMQVLYCLLQTSVTSLEVQLQCYQSIPRKPYQNFIREAQIECTSTFQGGMCL